MSAICDKAYTLVIQQALVAHWEFEQATGSTNWPDSLHGINLVRNGSGANGLTSEVGKVNNAVFSNKIGLLTSEALTTTGRNVSLGVTDLTKGLSVSVWFKVTGGLDGSIPPFNWFLFQNAISPNSDYIQIGYNFTPEVTGAFYAVGPAPNIDVTIPATGLDDEDWHLIVAVYDPSTHKIGISFDGSALVYSAGTRARSYGASGQVTTNVMAGLGISDSRHYDDLKLWPKALTDAEIQDLFNI